MFDDGSCEDTADGCEGYSEGPSEDGVPLACMGEYYGWNSYTSS